MSLVVGIRFREVGKIYYFDPNGVDLLKNDYCLVATDRGKELGIVILPEKEIPEEKIVAPLKQVLRKASPKDLARLEDNKKLEEEAYQLCLEKINERELPMKLVRVEYTFDSSKITFFFTAEGRVDFRELVKDLAYIFKTRIELRQIGVRDEAKKYGGIGTCGREFCCSSWLSDFVPVSIKMAKEQNLVLNPSKISGICGRLMCCLMYEYKTYHTLRKSLPKQGSIVNTPMGKGRVRRLDILKEIVYVQLENGEEVPLDKSKITVVPGGRKPAGNAKGKAPETPKTGTGNGKKEQRRPRRKGRR